MKYGMNKLKNHDFSNYWKIYKTMLKGPQGALSLTCAVRYLTGILCQDCSRIIYIKVFSCRRETSPQEAQRHSLHHGPTSESSCKLRFFGEDRSLIRKSRFLLMGFTPKTGLDYTTSRFKLSRPIRDPQILLRLHFSCDSCFDDTTA